MVCARCGKPVESTGRFCMHCGSALSAVPSASGTAVFEDEVSRQKRTMRWIVAIGVLGALAAAWIGLKASGALGLGAEGRKGNSLEAQGSAHTPSVLEAEGSSNPPSVLHADASQRPPVLDRPGQVVVMPSEIRDWLEHLRRTEEKRMRLAEDQMADMVVSLTLLQGGDPLSNLGDLLDPDAPLDPNAQAPSVKKTAEDAKRQSDEWAKLTTFFNSYPPPAECVPIRNEYDQVIRETGAMMIDVIDMVRGASSDPRSAISRLTRMQGKSKDRIDKPAVETDTLVDEICRKYNTRKWFDIKGDVGGGLFGKASIF